MIDLEASTQKRIEARYLFHPDRGARGELCAVIYKIDRVGRTRALYQPKQQNRMVHPWP